MLKEQLEQHVDRIAARARWIRVWRRLTMVWLAAAFVGLALLMLPVVAPQWGAASVPLEGVLFAVVGVVAISLLRRNRRRRFADRRQAARDVEREYPDLNDGLLAALEQQPLVETGQLHFLQQQVVANAFRHSRTHDWTRTAPRRQELTAFLIQTICLGLFAFVGFALMSISSGRDFPSASVRGLQIPKTHPADYGVQIEPGDTTLERGASLMVLARFQHTLPATVTLVVEHPERGPERIRLTKSLDDPLFGGRLPQVDRDVTYRVEYDQQQSPSYQVTVFSFPELQRADATVLFPNYTKLPETKIEDARQLSVVEGSTIRFDCQLNKPIAAGRIVSDSTSQPLDLTSADRASDRVSFSIGPATRSQTFRLELVDADGRSNKFPEEFVIDVVPNRPPELKLAFPARDLRVSPLEELALEANAWDDYGLCEFGLIYNVPAREPQTVVMGRDAPAKAPQPLVHLLSFEEMQAEPDQLVSYYFFADDVGPDGAVRRTFSDMYFAEVRHFDEIFREGPQMPGGGQMPAGGSQNAQQAEELANLQKEIINATWTLIRRETAPQLSQEFGPEVNVVKQSQESLLKKVDEFKDKLTDAKSKGFAAAVVEQMTAAVQHLADAAEHNSTSPLAPSLTAEQAAYQALLKLRAREHVVVQGQNGGGGGAGGGNRSEQQLQQLELSNKTNRYESEKSAASPQQTPANREQLQVLNRLRELARRQGDTNQKLKELEHELRLAQTEEEKAELRRQLKRLRDEQQQLLRDLDELRNRMDRPENQRDMADARQELEQARSRVQQTSESLEKGQVSQAVSSGTRAERELNRLRDDFRKKTAGQFTDAMHDLRQQARELSERQSELAEQIDRTRDQKSRTLRDTSNRDDIAKEVQDQKQRLDEVFDKTRDVIQEAEAAEPLLSRQLYETVRRTRQHQPAEALEATSTLLKQGLVAEAGTSEQQARRGVDEIRQGIEQAAESVLGNEAEALKLARRELTNLADAVRDEVAQAHSPIANDVGRAPAPAADDVGRALLPVANSETGKSARPTDARAEPSAAATTPAETTPAAEPQASQSPSSQSQQSSPSQSPRSNQSNQSDQSQPSSKTTSPSSSGLRQQDNAASTEGGLSSGPGGAEGPLTGSQFQEWSDRLRDVEEMVNDPQLRSEVARIREQARSLRVDFKRHSKEPNWDLVTNEILQPLVELQLRLAEEIAKREPNETLVPIDRDPVPERFTELVRRYYEQLGSEKR